MWLGRLKNTKSINFQIFIYLPAIALAAAGLFILLPFAFAQVSVTPSIVRLDLSTDQPQANIIYKNSFKETIEISLDSQDFKELENGYSLSYLGQKNVQNYHYGLSSWITFSDKTIVLNPRESKQITIFIQKDKLSQGSHYATILAQIHTQPKKGQINIQGILSSLLFVRTNSGREYENATLPTFEAIRNLLDFPQAFSFRFENQGDVDLTPYGQIKIYKGSELITLGIVNDSSAPTLPESIRRYYVTMRDPQKFLLPGIYKANIYLHFGKTNQKLTKTITFFSQGSIPFIPIVTLILIIGIVLWYRRNKIKK